MPGDALPPDTVPGIAAALALRIRSILPEGFDCIADETRILLVRDHQGIRSLDLAEAPEWRAESWIEDLCTVVRQALSDFQDEMVDQFWKKWPAVDGNGLPLPYVSIEEGLLHAGFELRGEVVVALEPMELFELGPGERGS